MSKKKRKTTTSKSKPKAEPKLIGWSIDLEMYKAARAGKA